MKIVYFALRSASGSARPRRRWSFQADVATVADLMAWLSGRGEEYAHAFENPKVIRAALDRSHARAATAITGAREIAFFPPMTGG